MMLDGTLVQYGTRGTFWRVGMVVGRYRDQSTGEMLCVRCAHNTVAGQPFDKVPAGNVAPATWEDLARSIEIERAEMTQRLSEFMDEVMTTATVEPA